MDDAKWIDDGHGGYLVAGPLRLDTYLDDEGAWRWVVGGLDRDDPRVDLDGCIRGEAKSLEWARDGAVACAKVFIMEALDALEAHASSHPPDARALRERVEVEYCDLLVAIDDQFGDNLVGPELCQAIIDNLVSAYERGAREAVGDTKGDSNG